ncbi:MAG: FAD binding domain-containing protein [Oscillospiraceae bacterium]
MLTIDQYVRAESLEQAYELCQKRNHVVLGGMLWLKMQDRKVGTAIDLCGLGLDRITETERAFELGAMVPLRALETHEGLNAMTRGPSPAAWSTSWGCSSATAPPWGAASLAASASPTCSPCCWPWTPEWCSRGRGN